jgi:regulator of protease activity HflC (stomatin/prohibitin superfamily)
MKAERDKREALLQAEGHKAAAITRAEGEKQAMILAAEGERDANIARAEGEAKAILLAKQAEAEGLRALREANASPAVLELKKYESLVALANGKAVKLIIPSDVVDTVRQSTLFSEVTELGAHTDPATEEAVKPKADPCCDQRQ